MREAPLSKKKSGNLAILEMYDFVFLEIYETYTNSHQTQRHTIPHESVICNPIYNFMICSLTCKTWFLMYVEDVLWMCVNQHTTVLTRQYFQCIKAHHYKANKHIEILTYANQDTSMNTFMHTSMWLHLHTSMHTLTQKPIQTHNA